MFDSGLGGLSIWKAIAATLPDWPITYLADQAYCPYGGRTQADLQQRSLTIARHLMEQQPQILVVACNTATTAAVRTLRAALPIPIVGVEPAIKPAAALSHTGKIAVLATEYTLSSERVQVLMDTHAQEVEVLRRPGIGWVEQVEAGDLSSLHTRELVNQIISPLLDENIDQIALGCTHYPFLAPLIRELTGDAIALYDPADAIARRVQSLLQGRQPTAQSGHRFMTTSHRSDDMATLLPVLIGQPYTVESVAL